MKKQLPFALEFIPYLSYYFIMDIEEMEGHFS